MVVKEIRGVNVDSMKHKKIDIESTEPINSIAEVDSVVDAFVERGGYITLEEDLKIRKRIISRKNLAFWIKYVKSKLVYKREKIVKHISEARVSFIQKHSSNKASAPAVKTIAKEDQNNKKVIKRSLLIDNYSEICKEDSTLRFYQQKAKKEIFESWDEIDNVMFQMPTGTGKTRLFTSIIRDINDYSLKRKEPVKILIVAHRTELIDQIDESLDKYKVPHSVIAGSKNRDYKKPVIVTSIQTITHRKNLRDAEKLNVRFVIIDEAHHALADSYKKLWDLYPESKKLGVTATPWRMNHQSFTDLFDKLVLSMPIKDFIKKGYLAPYKYFSLRSDSDILNTIEDIELDEFGDYMESSMQEKMDIGKIRAQLLQSYLALAEGKKGIIYAINIVHARHISEEYQEAGFRVVCIDNNTTDTERNDYVKKFKKGDLDIIVNVDIFSEGFDCPDIEFIQLARPTRSLVKYLQQVGRGLRITENKQECIILDNVGMYSRFGLPDARRHWKYHFLGHDVEDEEDPKRGASKGTGRTRHVDMSEGTEDMELIQDVYDEVDIIEKQPDSIKTPSAIDDFFPLWGITLGETTWKQVKGMGYKVEKWEDGLARHATVEEVSFWDHEGEGIFTSLYWVQDESDFPPLWQSKGFSWNLSFDEWLAIFKKIGYKIEVVKQPILKKHRGHDTLSAEFEALSPDGVLLFDLDFNYGKEGYYTSSPNTLYSITVDYNESPQESQIEEPEEEEIEEEELFDPLSILEANNYHDENFVFWFLETKKIYEAYIQDDKYYIISELLIDETNHCVHRKRVGKISMESWMFWQMEREKVDNLKSINHLGANYTIFHYRVMNNDNKIKDKFFDYKGREIESPSIVEAKFKEGEKGGKLGNFIDVPVSKATFRVDFLKKSKNLYISRTIKGETKGITMLSLQSDFAKRFCGSKALDNLISASIQMYRSDEGSFNLRVKEYGKTYLYKYSLKGKLIKKGTIAGNDDKIEAQIDDKKEDTIKSFVAKEGNLEIEHIYVGGVPSADSYIETDVEQTKSEVTIDFSIIEKVFEKKATTYKFFWFLAILQIYNETKNRTISYKNILIKMVSCAWKYVFLKNSVFPQIDQLPDYLDSVKKILELKNTIGKGIIEGRIKRYFDSLGVGEILSPLLNNVPYRFLSPWIPFTNFDDVIEKSNNPDIMCPYSLHEDYIVINPIWGKYFLENYEKLTQFVNKELRIYLKLQ